MTPTPPYWFNQRQGKAEPAGTNCFRLTAPNAKPALISIQQDANGLWSATLRREGDDAVAAATEPEFARPEDAWDAAFELYRVQVVV